MPVVFPTLLVETLWPSDDDDDWPMEWSVEELAAFRRDLALAFEQRREQPDRRPAQVRALLLRPEERRVEVRRQRADPRRPR